MTVVDGFMTLTGLVGAAYFAYGVRCGIAARRARQMQQQKQPEPEAVCASR